MMESPEGWADIWAQFAANLEAGWSWSGFERSAFFLNDGSAHFDDISNVLGTDQVSDGRGIAVGDIDNDGDLDLVGTTARTHPHVYVLRNDLPAVGHHLFVEAVPAEHRSPVGTRLLLTAGGITQRRDVAMGEGYLTQHDVTEHFGLGDATRVERLEISWPDGSTRVLEDLGVDRKLVVRQGEEPVEERPHQECGYSATSRLPDIEWDAYGDRLRLLSRPYPDLSWLEIPLEDGETLSLAVGPEGMQKGGPAILLNLWATWCANCKREMPDLVELHAQGTAGLRVVGLAMDGPEDGELVAETMERWGIDFPNLHLTGPRLNRVMRVLDELLGSEAGQSLPLPTSLLLTPGGKVLGIAQGAIDIENLVRYLETVRR